MNRDRKNVENHNESLNLFIEELSMIILDTILERYKGIDNHNCIETASCKVA